MSAMASRTLLVNPNNEQKAAYILAFDALQLLINSLKIGEPICSAYQQVKKFIETGNPAVTINNNFGFGIGFNFKEDALTINATNQNIIKNGMVFHVRIAL
jgi:nucleosome binding factor SPN SPT16 subunit